MIQADITSVLRLWFRGGGGSEAISSGAPTSCLRYLPQPTRPTPKEIIGRGGTDVISWEASSEVWKLTETYMYFGVLGREYQRVFPPGLGSGSNASMSLSNIYK
jgi:hypothetical protein